MAERNTAATPREERRAGKCSLLSAQGSKGMDVSMDLLPHSPLEKSHSQFPQPVPPEHDPVTVRKQEKERFLQKDERKHVKQVRGHEPSHPIQC